MLKKLNLLLVLALLALITFFHTNSYAKEQEKMNIVSKNENSTVYEGKNGKRKIELYMTDVRYKNSRGEMIDYDTSLIKKNDTFETEKSDKVSVFPEVINEDNPVVTKNEKYRVKVYWGKDGKEESKECEPIKEVTSDLYGNDSKKVTALNYEGYSKKTDVMYESSLSGLKESIILKEKSLSDKYEFVFEIDNAVLISQNELTKDKPAVLESFDSKKNESLFLYDEKEECIIGAIPAAYMTDAAGKYSSDCYYKVRRRADKKYSVEIVVSDDFLNDSSTKYPVTIDPSVTWCGSTAPYLSSVYISKKYPTRRYLKSNTNICCIGKREDTTDVCRTYFSLDGINSLLKDYYVDSAKLCLNTTQASKDMTVYVKGVNASFDPATITYNSQPTLDEDILGSFKTKSNAEALDVDLDADIIYNKVRNNEKMYGLQMTDTADNNNSTSTKSCWIYNESSVNSSKVPKVVMDCYSVNSTNTPVISYKAYTTANKWTAQKKDGYALGNIESRKIKALSLNIQKNGCNLNGLQARVLYSNGSWSSWKPISETIGSTSTSDYVKAIEIKEEGAATNPYYDVYYRTKVKESNGKDSWLGWAKNGETAGSDMSGDYVYDLQVEVVPNIIYYVGSSRINIGYHYNKRNDGDIYKTSKLNGIYGFDFKFADINFQGNSIALNINYTDGSTREYSFPRNDQISNYGYIYSYCIYFKSIETKSKYDIWHWNAGNSSFLYDSIRKNNSILQAKNNSPKMEMCMVSIQPKGNKYGKKSYLTEKFINYIDGINGNNVFEPFCSDYTEEQYEVVTGDHYDGQSKSNEGCCMGMTLSALLLKKGVFELQKLTNKYDNGAEFVFALNNNLDGNSKLADFAKKLQLSNNLSLIKNDPIDDYKEIVKLIQKKPGGVILSMANKTPKGHAVIAKSVKEVEAGIYEIEVYDVNGYENEIYNAKIYINGYYRDNEKMYFKYTNYFYVKAIDFDSLCNNNMELFSRIYHSLEEV